jgi:hypothetical protein
MGKKFKREENDVIWESYTTPNDQKYADDYNEYNTFEDEDAEAIITMEKPLMVEPEMGDDGIFEDDDDLFEDEDDDLDNEIIVKALRKLIKRADILLNHCESDSLDTWMVAKIIKAEDYISDVWNELDDVADFANDGFEDVKI